MKRERDLRAYWGDLVHRKHECGAAFGFFVVGYLRAGGTLSADEPFVRHRLRRMARLSRLLDAVESRRK